MPAHAQSVQDHTHTQLQGRLLKHTTSGLEFTRDWFSCRRTWGGALVAKSASTVMPAMAASADITPTAKVAFTATARCNAHSCNHIEEVMVWRGRREGGREGETGLRDT